ncbi:sensor protein [Escherichia coli]|uniref:Sensor protein n=1 Tax=Escherichia coli TaxID=562 RepID=A0A2X3KAZ0_ECOLX|nr:sensor protein [Escherichia coli]
MNKNFVVASAIRHLAMLLTDGYSTNFSSRPQKAVASKGISIALPLSVAGLSSATLVNDLLEQLENSPLPPRLLHLIIPAEAILDSRQ